MSTFYQAVLDHVSGINYCNSLFKVALEFLNRKTLTCLLEGIFVHHWHSLLVDLGIVEKVFWRCWEVIGYFLNKFILIIDQECIIVLILGLDITKVSSTNWFTTCWTWSMSWIKCQLPIQSLDFLNWVKQHSCKIFCRDIRCNSQIWSSNFSQKDSITSKDTKLLAILVSKDEASGL